MIIIHVNPNIHIYQQTSLGRFFMTSTSPILKPIPAGCTIQVHIIVHSLVDHNSLGTTCNCSIFYKIQDILICITANLLLFYRFLEQLFFKLSHFHKIGRLNLIKFK